MALFTILALVLSSFIFCSNATTLAEAFDQSLVMSGMHPSELVPRGYEVPPGYGANPHPIPCHNNQTVCITDFWDCGLMGHYGNPDILKVGNTLYAFASHINYANGSSKYYVPTAYNTNASSPHRGWLPGTDALTNFNAQNWTLPHGSADVWGPSVSRLYKPPFPNMTYVMYFSAKKQSNYMAPNNNNERCIGIAYSSHPNQSFVPAKDAIYCDPKGYGSINTYVVHDFYKGEINQSFVLFKDGSDHNGKATNTKNVSFALLQVDSSTGLPTGKKMPHKIVDEGTNLTYSWEGPSITQIYENRWLLLHTTGVDNTDMGTQGNTYKINYAISNRGIVGPYNETQFVLLPGNTTNQAGKVTVQIPGGPKFVGRDNKAFFFFANPYTKATNNENQKRLFYATLNYSYPNVRPMNPPAQVLPGGSSSSSSSSSGSGSVTFDSGYFDSSSSSVGSSSYDDSSSDSSESSSSSYSYDSAPPPNRKNRPPRQARGNTFK